jgi:nucleotide sugar dehydrogenase
MKTSIIGSGVVGKATGIGLQKHGNEVLFHDIIKEKLIRLKKQGYSVTESISEAVNNSTISLVCVQTPTVNGQMDFSYVKKATIDIGKALRRKKEYHDIVIRSTVLPFITRTKVIPLLEQHSRLEAGEDFGVCVNPEFLRQADALSNFLKPGKIVIGELDARSGDQLEMLYAPFNVPIFRTDLETAEMIKYVANIFLTTKISFFNEMHIICKRLDLDPHFISEVVASDPRIGKYGIYGGQPFEGSCLPKDLEAFINFVKSKELNPKLLDAVLHINKKIAGIGDVKGESE